MRDVSVVAMMFIMALWQFLLFWGRARLSRTRRVIGLVACTAVCALGLARLFFDEPLLAPVSDKQHSALTIVAAILLICAGISNAWSSIWLAKPKQKEAATNSR